MERSNIKYSSVEVVYVDNSGAERRCPIAKATSSEDAISQFKEISRGNGMAVRVEQLL